MFGKRNRPAPPPEDAGHGGPGGSLVEPEMPWAGDPAEIACNLATGNLANNLMAWVEEGGRVHAETYVAVSGAIAGYAAQRTLTKDGAAYPPGMQMATTPSGEKYLFGEPLNDMLWAKTEAEAGGRVWARAAGAAVSVGLPVERMPNFENMFGHVSRSLGGPLEGRPSTGPDHQPGAPVRELLARHWPRAANFLAADFDELHRRFGPVPVAWWGAVAAYATARPIIDVKNVLDPAIALTIMMESAIYASKLMRF